MSTPTVYDPSQDDSLGALRGGGRVVSILRQNLEADVRFVSSLSKVSEEDTLLIPLWRPFQPPLLNRRIAAKQILMLFDAIPLKYPQHFPIGIKGRWRLIQNLRSLSVFDKIITISEHAKEDIAEYMSVDPDNIDVVYPTTSSIYFKPSKSSLTKTALHKKYTLPKDYCIYVGDTNWNKNLVNIAQALVKADITGVFVGKTFELIQELREKDEAERQDYFANSPLINHPEQREFKEFIKLTIHDDKRFIFPGFVPDAEMLLMYRHAVCNVLVSRDEGFGLSYLESATQKCPSILADKDIFHETADKTALFADPELHEDIAKNLNKLFSSAKTRTALGKKAFTRSKQYAPHVFRKSMLDILKG